VVKSLRVTVAEELVFGCPSNRLLDTKFVLFAAALLVSGLIAVSRVGAD
jgi:hypothetical protein